MSQSPTIDTCDSIQTCVSINRIISYLHVYQTMDIETLSKTFTKSNYPFLTDDFNHVLIHHLCDAYSLSQTRGEFEAIHNYIMSKLKHCNIETCVGYQRNNRNREKENISLRNNDGNESRIDDKAEYYVDTLDTMHSFFLHTFDVGFRIKSTEFNINQDSNADDVDVELYQDLAMKKLSTLLRSKRQRLKNIRGTERTTKTKFITNIDSQNVIYETHKDIKVDEKDEKKDDTKPSKTKNKSYSFGIRYNYWNRKDKNYVTPKYKNMKHELLDNTIFKIDLANYNSAKQKAKRKLSSKYAKSLKSDGYAENEYGIKAESVITRPHLMAVIFYTDFDVLSYNFSSTFRALQKENKTKKGKASIDSCKLRNSEYAMLSRLLCETVNAFGNRQSKHIPVYYHGISGLLIFSSFLATFNSPTSTTMQIEVAVIFAKNNGAILELQKHSKWLSYFNCSWLSAYCNEDERLFINPIERYQLKFSSIRSITEQQILDYRCYIHALTALNYAVNCDKPKGRDIINKTDIKIIRKLVMNESSKFPQYIQDTFTAFSKKKKRIAFKMKYINKYYPQMLSLFFYDKAKKKDFQLIKLATICNAFPHCKSVSVDYNDGDWESPKLFELNSCFFDGLLTALDLLNKQSKNTAFKSVKFDYIQIQNQHVFDKYKRKLMKQNWKMADGRLHQRTLKSITIKHCDDDEKDEKTENDNKRYNKNKNVIAKIPLKVKGYQGIYNHRRHPSNLLEGGESVFYSSAKDNTSGDWIIFEMAHLANIKKIKIKNYVNKKLLVGSGIKKISLWLGNEESIKNNKWYQFTKDISAIKQTRDDQYFITDSNITTQEMKDQQLNLIKLIIDKNHGHKSYNCFYEFVAFGIAL